MKMNYLDRFEAKVALIIITVGVFLIASPVSAQQQQPPSSARTIRKSEEILQSEAITRIQPRYPPLALAVRVPGTVKVEVIIDEGGNVISASALSGHALLKDSAVAAARRWKFNPTMAEGIPVKVTGIISFAFDPDTYVADPSQEEDKGEKQKPLTPEEEQKLRRAEEAADLFIQRWHETLDMNVLFEEMYVSNPAQRRRNAYLFYGVYKFISVTAYNPGVEKNVDESVMREGFMSFWNVWYMVTEYGLAFRQSDDDSRALPPDVTEAVKELKKIKLSDKYIKLIPVKAYTAKANIVSSLFRKYLPREVFSTTLYKSNSKEYWAADNKYSPAFRIIHGFEGYGVGKEIEVYNLRRGIFAFYFVEEGGKLKVLTLGFEL